MTDDPMRGTGRTTGKILAAMGEASLNPGVAAVIQDAETVSQSAAIANAAKLMAETLKLVYRIHSAGLVVSITYYPDER